MQLSDSFNFDSDEKSVSSISDKEYMPGSLAESSESSELEESFVTDNEYVVSSEMSLSEEYFSEDSYGRPLKRKHKAGGASRVKTRKSNTGIRQTNKGIRQNNRIKGSHYRQRNRNKRGIKQHNRHFTDNSSSDYNTSDYNTSDYTNCSKSIEQSRDSSGGAAHSSEEVSEGSKGEFPEGLREHPQEETSFDIIERVVKVRMGLKGEVGPRTSVYHSLTGSYIESVDCAAGETVGGPVGDFVVDSVKDSGKETTRETVVESAVKFLEDASMAFSEIPNGDSQRLPHRVSERGLQRAHEPFFHEEQFLIKWRFRAYIHATWENRESLNNPKIKGIKKIDNFVKNIKNNIICDLGISAECGDSINEYTCVERIIGARYQESQTRPAEFLCKWRNLQYEDSTWETIDVINKLYSSALNDFYSHQNNTIIPFDRRSLVYNYDKNYLFTKIDDLNVNSNVNKDGLCLKMRDYQIEGIKWLMHSACLGKGVILADEMGLGKTVQIIKYLDYFYNIYNIKGPSLIIVPLSTIDNWSRHFAIWASQLYVISFSGTMKSRDIIKDYEIHDENTKRLKFNVILTTYELVFKEAEFFSSLNWFSLIIDEGHRIKNENSLLYKCLISFNSFQRVLVTGTPLQNSLRELYALLHFINPNKFSDPMIIEQFNEFEDKHAGYEQLKLFISDYILRRTKKDVEKSLPPKTEQILRVDMTNLQKKYYKIILTKNYEELAKEARGSVGGFLNIIMELKKCCNHTNLVSSDPPTSDINKFLIGSGKLILLDKLLTRLHSNKNRVLIFSQMVTMLDILSQYLNLRGFSYQRLDGSVGEAARVRAIDHFNAPDSTDFCFLLSTKAGGLGINLVTADTVIIYDSDWNPQNDLQAQARAHRIGQKKQVKIYRLVTKSSIEENIIERAKRKMVLDHLVIQTMDPKFSGISSTSVRFSKEELTLILKFGAEELFKENIDDGTQEPLQQMDLDDIIKVSDPNDLENPIQSRGEEFLSSFKVANFNTEEIERDIDQDIQWKNIIPKEIIEKIENDKIAAQAEVPLPPRRKIVKHHNNVVSESESNDESKTYFPNVKSKDLKKFLRYYFKFCNSCNRVKDILNICNLNDSDLQAFEQIAKYIESCYNNKDSPSIITINNTPFDLSDFKNMRLITDPIGNKVLEFTNEGGEIYKYSIQLSKSLKAPWNSNWNKTDDSHLFLGIYLYGMENWKAITTDKSLDLDEKLRNSRHKVPTSLIYEHLSNVIKLFSKSKKNKSNKSKDNKNSKNNKESKNSSPPPLKPVVEKPKLVKEKPRPKSNMDIEGVDENVIKKCAKLLSSVKKNIHNIEGVSIKDLLKHKEDLKKIGGLIYSDKMKTSNLDSETLWNFVFRFTSLSSCNELISFYSRKIGINNKN